MTFLLVILGAVGLTTGTAQAQGVGTAAKAPPYWTTTANPWQIFSTRYGQHVDATTSAELYEARTLVLVADPARMPLEQGRVRLPEGACLYQDGRFVAYVQNETIDLNAWLAGCRSHLTIYLPGSALAAGGVRGVGRLSPWQAALERSQRRQAYQVAAGPLALAPDLTWRDTSMGLGLILLLMLSLAMRDPYFFRVLRPDALVSGDAQLAANPLGLGQFFGYQSVLHLLMASLGASLFLYLYYYGADPQLTMADQGGEALVRINLERLGRLYGQSLMMLLALAAYIFLIGLSLFNVKIEGSHVRGNLETFTVGGVTLGLWAGLYQFSGAIRYEAFVLYGTLFMFILFGVKGFYLYKVLVMDRGLKKFYTLSYICMTEFLPSLVLLRLLTRP